jgi:hypothetical protein
MGTCSKCGKEFTPGTAGWMARLEGPPGGVHPGAAFTKILLCAQDFSALGRGQKAMWHEHIDPFKGGPTREKRPGHLGEA